MARKIMGSRVVEVVCPLCDTGYYMTSDEVHLIDMDDENSMAYFWCEVCERNIKIDPKDKADIRPAYVPRDFFD